jgi:hypothetical protein
MLIKKNITHGGEAMDKYLVYVIKWVALEGSRTFYFY